MARNNDNTKVLIVAEVMEAGVDTQVLRGKSFSITGHLGLPRDKIVEMIQAAGGRYDKTPAWGTTYLITNLDWSGERNSSKKLVAAHRNGIKILKEADFLKMLAVDGNT